MSVLIPAIIGIAIFRGLIIPTGTLHVYDPVRNAYQAVGDVPDAVILVAGVLNKIERGVVEIIETAAADPAAERSGSLRYSLVLNALTSKRQDTYFERNSSIYFTECGFPLMGMGYNGASLDGLMRNSADLIDEWEKWRHPSIFATIYSGAGDQKVTMSCRDVWDNALKPTATDTAQFAEMVESICRKVGFDPSVAAQATRCEEELTSLQDLYGLAATGSLPFVRSVVFAHSVTDAMRDADISVQQGALVNRQIIAEGFGAAEAMDRWVPKLRGFMTATVLGLVPLVCLFMLTPVMSKALSLVIGLFLWLALWGVSDAISVQMAVDAAADAFDEIGRFGLSYDSLMLSPEAAIQSLGVFGKARTMALMLATVLSYGLFSFGGYAFTSMAQAWQSDLQQAGESAGRTALNPEERGSMLGRLTASSGAEASIATGGFQNAAYAAAASGMRSLGGVTSDRGYVSGALQGGVQPGGAGGAPTRLEDSTLGSSLPGSGGTGGAGGASGVDAAGGVYVSDRLSGVSESGAQLKPGGAGGTDTRPSGTAPTDDPRARGVSDGRSILVGGAGGAATEPPSTRPHETRPSGGDLGGARSVETSAIGGAGGADSTPRDTRPSSGDLREPLGAPVDGESSLPDITVQGSGYRPDNYGPRARSVAELDMQRGALDAGDSQGRLGAMFDLSEKRDVPLDRAARDIAGTRTSREASRTESYRQLMSEDRTSVSEGGAFEGAADFGRYTADRTVFGNVNGTEERTVQTAGEYGAFTNAASIGQSEVVTADRLAQNYGTQTVIQTESNRAIEERGAAESIGEAQGVNQTIDAAAFDRTRDSFGSTDAGERAMVEGQAASMTSRAAYGVTLSQTPEGTTGAAKMIGENEGASAIAERRIVDSVRETLSLPDTSSGLVQTQESLRGSRSVVMSAEQTQSFIENTPGLELTSEQAGIAAEGPVRANIGIAGDQVVTADLVAGTSVSKQSVAREDYSFSVAGGLMALDQLDKSLISITGGDPIHGKLDSEARMSVARTIASAIEGSGASVSASRTESQTVSAGVSMGGRMGKGTGGTGKGFGTGSVGLQGQYSGQRSDDSSSKLDGTLLEGNRILEDARESARSDFERSHGGAWERSVSPEEFARQWNERIKDMTFEAAERIRKDGETALETHDPIKAGEHQREQLIEPSDRKYSDKELAYMGGQRP